jgi:hypothetical protein
MSRWIRVSIAVAVLIASVAVAEEKYTGPKCLGPFCINRATTTNKLFQQLGRPPRRASFYCFQAENGRSFLNLATIHTEPAQVGDVILSDFANCMHTTPQITSDDLQSWKTPEGIGLGSSEADVLKAYGRPPSQDKIVPWNETPSAKGIVTERFIYSLRIRGYQGGEKGPSVGDKRLFYNSSDYEDPSAAEFGIRKGVVSYIWLSINE